MGNAYKSSDFSHPRGNFSRYMFEGFLQREPTLRIIFLERTNVVKMALATNANEQNHQRWPGASNGQPLNGSWLAEKVTGIVRGYATIRLAVSDLPIPLHGPTQSGSVLHVRYEELQLDTGTVANQVSSFLGVTPELFKVVVAGKRHSES